MTSVLKLINSKEYNSLLNEIIAKKEIEINDKVHEVLIKIHENSIEKVAIPTENLIELLRSEDKHKLSNFIVGILSLETEDDDGGEFPKGEEPDEDDKPKLIKVHPYPKSFSLNMLLEYYILKNKPSELEAFLKKIRIPGSKKFAKQLRHIYNNL